MAALRLALVWFLFTCCASVRVEASCSGTLFYKLTTAPTAIQAVSVTSFGSSYATNATFLAGTEDATAGVGANGDYLCYLAEGSTISYITCLRPSQPTSIHPGEAPTGFISASQIQVAWTNGHIALTRTSASSEGRNTLHSIQDFHNETWIPEVIEYEAGYPETPALALVPLPSKSLLYHYKSGYMSMEVWNANSPLLLPSASTKNQSETDVITSLAYSGSTLFALTTTGFKYLDIKEAAIGSWTALDLHPYLSSGGAVTIASTSSSCSSILVSKAVSSHASEMYLYHPFAQKLESITNTTSTTVSHLTWTDYLMNPTPAPEKQQECAQPPPEPASAFECDHATLIWTASGSVNTSSVVVYGPVAIAGDLDVTTSITFNGLDASINVSGCVNLRSGGLQLQLTPAELAELLKSKTKSQILLTSGCPLPASLQVQVAAAGKKKCQKLTSVSNTAPSETSSNRNSLSVVLRLDDKSCNTWWIVLAAVLGALVLIAVVAFALLATFNNKVKATFRPFWTRKATEREHLPRTQT